MLDDAGVAYEDLAAIAFYEKPFLKFERLLETYHHFAPRGLASFVMAMPVWLKEKLFMRRLLAEQLQQLGEARHRIYYPEHHLSHAASAFYPSPFDDAAILTIDGVGEWATTTIGRGRGAEIEVLSELQFPHSVGLLYSAFTYYLGFAVNSGEYKLMGLAPYGHPDSARTAAFRATITRELVDIRSDGSILLNMEYFDFATGLRMANEARWERLFGMPRRAPESEISQAHMDLALAIQQVTEDDRASPRAHRAHAHRQPESGACGRRGAQLRGERKNSAGANVRRPLDSTGGGRCGRRARRRLRRLAHP